MNEIFNLIGSLFGYLLWGAFCLVKNFAIAILLFTIVLRIIQFPMQIKSQKNMAANMRLQKKQKEIQEKYGRDKAKASEEMSKLYEKENINPMSGCLTTLIPMFLLMGVYWTVRNPLTNTLHIDKNSVQEALNYLKGLPVIGGNINAYYGEINLIGYFSDIKDNLTCFTSADISKIETFANGFTLFGMNLLDASAYISYTVPSAMGLYWIYSSLIGFISTLVLHKFYNAESMTALEEARRIALLETEEAGVRQVVRTYNTVGNSSKNKKKKKK